MGMTPSSRSPSAPPAPARRPPFLVRVFTSPVTVGAVERRIARTLRPAIGVALSVAPFAFGLLLLVLAVELWTHRTPALEPRHRAEALCFELAQAPRFMPPMTVEPSAALVKGRFPLGTPAGIALRMTMHFDDPQVVEEASHHVGDFEVTNLWLRVPERGETHYWLVIGWMEGADLAVCNFRFEVDSSELTDEERLWGRRLMGRILVPQFFMAGTLPHVRLRAEPGEAIPHFGPRAQS